MHELDDSDSVGGSQYPVDSADSLHSHLQSPCPGTTSSSRGISSRGISSSQRGVQRSRDQQHKQQHKPKPSHPSSSFSSASSFSSSPAATCRTQSAGEASEQAQGGLGGSRRPTHGTKSSGSGTGSGRPDNGTKSSVLITPGQRIRVMRPSKKKKTPSNDCDK